MAMTKIGVSCRRIIALLAILALSLPALPVTRAQSEKTPFLVKIYADPATGLVHIIDSNGKDVVPRAEKDQVAVDSLKIAEDKQTAGWLVDVPNCCTSYPIPLTLVIYRSWKILHRMGNGMLLGNWCFIEGGKQVAFYTNTVHGDFAPHYELRDVVSGRLLAKYDGHLGPRAPAWSQAFAEE